MRRTVTVSGGWHRELTTIMKSFFEYSVGSIQSDKLIWHIIAIVDETDNQSQLLWSINYSLDLRAISLKISSLSSIQGKRY